MKYEGWSIESLLEEAGERLRDERLNRNMTQEELAERAGVSTATLRSVESGGNPTLRVVLLLLRALGLLDRFDAFLPAPTPSPLQAARLQKEQRQRASGRRDSEGGAEDWEW